MYSYQVNYLFLIIFIINHSMIIELVNYSNFIYLYSNYHYENYNLISNLQCMHIIIYLILCSFYSFYMKITVCLCLLYTDLLAIYSILLY